jgi:hypothetical protein
MNQITQINNPQLSSYEKFVLAAKLCFECEGAEKPEDTRFYFFVDGAIQDLVFTDPDGWDWDYFNKKNHNHNYNPYTASDFDNPYEEYAYMG